jgi:hypothetical protein
METPTDMVTAWPAGKVSSAPAPWPAADVAADVVLPTYVDVTVGVLEKRAEKYAV